MVYILCFTDLHLISVIFDEVYLFLHILLYFLELLNIIFLMFFILKMNFFCFFRWLGFIFLNLKDYILFFLINLLNNNLLFLSKFFENFFLSNIFFEKVILIKLYIYNNLKFKDSGKFIYFWESMSFKDESF